MGSPSSNPQQEAQIRGQQISAQSWMQRTRQNKQAQQAQQFATKADLRVLQHQLHQDLERNRPDRTTAGKAVAKGGKMLAHGFRQINRSMTHLDAPNGRPAISQMPVRPPIARGYDLNKLKDPHMRNRDIIGRRLK